MPLMTKMREKLSLVFGIFAALFIIYIVLDWGMDIGGRKQMRMQQGDFLGTVNGEKITYQEFNAQVERAIPFFREQYRTDPDENQMMQIREEVWDMVVTQILMKQEIERMGLDVTDQEIRDWVNKIPETLPDMIRKNFDDSTGALNHQFLQQAIQAQDPQVKSFWMQTEALLRENRVQQKMSSILFSSILPTEGEMLSKYNDESIKVNAKYVFFDPSVYVTDEEVAVSDDDIKAYYEKHRNEYKQDENRKLRVAIFEVLPSRQDSLDVQNILKSVQEDISKGIDFITLVDMHSDKKYDPEEYIKPGEVGSESLEKLIFNAKAGDYIGPITEGNSTKLIKVINFREGRDLSIRTAHILIKFTEQDKEAKRAEANSLLSRIRRGESITDLAMQHSEDPSVYQNSGDLGWVGKGRFVKEYEDAAFAAKVGEVIGPIETQYGFHVIKVLDKAKREINIAELRISIAPSAETREYIYNEARNFMNVAKDENFDNASKIIPAIVQETQWFTKKGFIPGLGYHSAISKFAFDNKVGTVSDIYKIQNVYVIVQVSDLKKEGYADFNEVKDYLKSMVLLEKKIEKLNSIVNDLRNQIGNGPIEKLTELDARAVVFPTGEFSIGGSIPGIGQDGKITGKLYALQPNTISRPIVGSRGIYLFNIINKSEFNTADYFAKRNQIFTQLDQQKKNQFLSQWVQGMMDKADIQDNRDRYFR
jgi:parvulin-like peptidyl-prolyl isomerase